MYRFQLGDLTVECESADEVRAAANGSLSHSNGHANEEEIATNGNGHTEHELPRYWGRGVKASWRRAKRYAEKYNLSVSEARAILAKERPAKTRRKKQLTA
jgi:hypothetical protein